MFSKMMIAVLLTFSGFSLWALPEQGASSPDTLRMTDVFRGTRQKGEHTYRIPSLCLARNGDLLAFAELRKNGSGDSGDIATVVSRSKNGGKSWSKPAVVLDIDKFTIGNACPIVDPESGKITVVAVWNKVHEYQTEPGFGQNSRLVYMTSSLDNGKTWSKPEDISRQVKDGRWGWFATGPGAGIVLSKGPHRGRYVVGVNHKLMKGDQQGYYAHVIYSDDQGKSWKSSKNSAARHTNECEAAELSNGNLMLNMRNHGSQCKNRAVAVSTDGGETWGETRWDGTLIEPQCMGSLIRYRSEEKPDSPILLFSNPATRGGRKNLTVRTSFDDGQSWPRALVIEPGEAAYSHMTLLPDGDVGLLYEGENCQVIKFVRIPKALLGL